MNNPKILATSRGIKMPYRPGAVRDVYFCPDCLANFAQGASGKWWPSRPLPYYSFWARLRQAWDVLRYRADALYWTIDYDKDPA